MRLGKLLKNCPTMLMSYAFYVFLDTVFSFQTYHAVSNYNGNLWQDGRYKQFQLSLN